MADEVLDPAHDDSAVIPDKVEVKAEEAVKVSDDGNMLERGGRKYVPLEALQQSRDSEKTAKQQLKALEPFAEEIQQAIEVKRGRSQKVAANDTDYTDDDLQGFAANRGWVLEDGVTPDTKRAARELDIISRVADRRVTRQVQPLAHLTQQDRAAVNRARAKAETFADGEPIADAAYIDKAFDLLPPELAADPGVAAIVKVLGMGLQAADQRVSNKTKNRREPGFSEHSSSRNDSDNGAGLSQLDLAAARARGKSPDDWAKQRNKVANDVRKESVFTDV